MTDEMTKVLKLKGSIKNLGDTLEEVIKVANNHEDRYHDKWQGMRPIDAIVMVREKLSRIEDMTDPLAQLEEMYDLSVYSLFSVWHYRQKTKDFKYPSTEDKTERDHRNE